MSKMSRRQSCWTCTIMLMVFLTLISVWFCSSGHSYSNGIEVKEKVYMLKKLLGSRSGVVGGEEAQR